MPCVKAVLGRRAGELPHPSQQESDSRYSRLVVREGNGDGVGAALHLLLVSAEQRSVFQETRLCTRRGLPARFLRRGWLWSC